MKWNFLSKEGTLWLKETWRPFRNTNSTIEGCWIWLQDFSHKQTWNHYMEIDILILWNENIWIHIEISYDFDWNFGVILGTPRLILWLVPRQIPPMKFQNYSKYHGDRMKGSFFYQILNRIDRLFCVVYIGYTL